LQGGPLEHIIAAKAVALAEASTDEFKQYARQVVVNAATLAEAVQAGGLRVVSGGTENHLLLIDLGQTNESMTGKQAEERLDRVHITVNKNTVPRETRSPFITSGLRLGTAAVTTRQLKEADMYQLAEYILAALDKNTPENKLPQLSEAVSTFISPFYLP
jgi:glycine hydroxymethyltransferase